jgi:hypothetical protein
MIVTTCGAAGALSLPARTGGGGFFGDGAGVCALTTDKQSATLTKIAARIVLLTFIYLPNSFRCKLIRVLHQAL